MSVLRSVILEYTEHCISWRMNKKIITKQIQFFAYFFVFSNAGADWNLMGFTFQK